MVASVFFNNPKHSPKGVFFVYSSFSESTSVSVVSSTDTEDSSLSLLFSASVSTTGLSVISSTIQSFLCGFPL